MIFYFSSESRNDIYSFQYPLYKYLSNFNKMIRNKNNLVAINHGDRSIVEKQPFEVDE